MTFQDLLKLTRRHFVAILVLTLAGAAAAFALLQVTPQQYTAGSTAYVRVAVPDDDGTGANANAYYTASQLASQKVKAFVPVFTSETVAQAVIDELDLSDTPTELASRITASNATNSLTISVTATAPTAEEARSIADTVVDEAAGQVKRLEGASSPVEVVMMAPASLSSITVAPSVPKYMAAGVLAGLLIGYLIAFAMDRFDTRLRTLDDITTQFDIPVLGVIPQSSTIARTEEESGDFHAEESIRKLRTNLRYVKVDGELRIIVVTSPTQGDGKSSIAGALAKVMALAGQEVVLVDADLRRPTAREVFGIKARLGLTQVLVGSARLDQGLHHSKVPGLSILTAGDIPPNPSEILGSDRMAELMRYLARDHVVVIDAPPVLPVTDAAVMSKFGDGVVMVGSAGRTRTEQLARALEGIDQAGGTVLGIVLNRVASSKLARLRYGDAEYGYGYGYSRTEYTYETNGRTEDVTGTAASRRRRLGRRGEPITSTGSVPAIEAVGGTDDERPLAVGRESIMPIVPPPPAAEPDSPATPWEAIAVGEGSGPNSSGSAASSTGGSLHPVSVRRSKVKFVPLHASRGE